MEATRGRAARVLFLLRQRSQLSVGHAHRDGGRAGRGDGALVPVQPARNTDRAEQHGLHPERGEDELCLARRGAPREASRHPVRRSRALPGRSGPAGVARRAHRRAGGLVRPYSRATFHAWFVDRHAPGVGGHVERVLSSLGKSPEETADVIARAGSAEGARLMQDATEATRKLGIFGAPTFAVGTEIFWGDDRLEEAIAFAVR